MQYKKQQQQQKTEYQECTVYQGFLNSYFLQYLKQFIETKATVTNS